MEFVDECGTLGNAKKIFFKEEKTMDNFIFSVNVTIPIFLIILLGYILRRIGFLTDEFVRVANKYVFIVALPVMLFRDIAGSDVRKDMNVKFFLFCMIVTIIMFFLVWGIAKLTLKDKTMVGAFAQGEARQFWVLHLWRTSVGRSA